MVKWILSDWQVSGVTKFISGTPITPTCTSTVAGVASTDPSYTGLGTSATNAVTSTRCQLTGQPIFSGYTVDPDPLLALHFNPAAFAMATPVSATVGNFGNTPLGLLRNPSWSNWDLTWRGVSRCRPWAKLACGCNSGVQRLQPGGMDHDERLRSRPAACSTAPLGRIGGEPRASVRVHRALRLLSAARHGHATPVAQRAPGSIFCWS